MSASLLDCGFSVSFESNVNDLVSCRSAKRSGAVTPFFDPEVCGLDESRFFWLKLCSQDHSTVGIEAFRFDHVATSLFDWAPSYHIGLYMRRKELCVPTFIAPPAASKTREIRGNLVYHGELWIDPRVRNRKVLDAFTKLGLVLSYLKWNADAIWALTSEQMATHGHAHRMGYAHVESGFLRWDWAPEGNPTAEYLLLSDRSALEHIILEANLKDAAAASPVFQESAQVLPFRQLEYPQEQVL
jgi:hypothetical protein